MNNYNKYENEDILKYFRKTTCKYHIAFYNTFPGFKNPEFELLKRLQIACNNHNIGFFVIHNNNIIQNGELRGANINDIDTIHILCAISLHFNTPKTSKHYTLMTIWNPLQFHSNISWKNTFSVDGYLSAYSDNIDNFVTTNTGKPIIGYLNPTICDPILDFTFGKYICFYAGMNWSISYDTFRVNIYNLIKALDNSDTLLSIYGPKKSWMGYKCYQEEIPFDGYSIIQKIHDCGICLVLSSQPHINDSVSSCRIFEGLAAGVPIISDKNPFVQKWFGDNVLYIDTEDAGACLVQINEHVAFIREHSEDMLVKMENCRRIFLDNFLLDQQLLKVLMRVSAKQSKT